MYSPYQYEDDLLVWKGDQWRCLNANERMVILGFPSGYLDVPHEPLTEDAKCELAGDVMAMRVISRLLASLPEAPGVWPPLPLVVEEGKIMVTGDDSDDHRAPGQEPVALNGEPVEAEVDQGSPMFRAKEVVEMSKRQQNIARQIVRQMEGRGPYGIVDGSVSGQGILRKVLPMLWAHVFRGGI